MNTPFLSIVLRKRQLCERKVTKTKGYYYQTDGSDDVLSVVKFNLKQRDCHITKILLSVYCNSISFICGFMLRNKPVE